MIHEADWEVSCCLSRSAISAHRADQITPWFSELGRNKRLQPRYFRQFVWAIKILPEVVSASALREIESSYWLEGAPPLKKAHSTTSQESDYSTTECTLFGSKFLPLRTQFALAPHHPVRKGILVCFGGADHHGLTSAFLHEMMDLNIILGKIINY